MKNKPGKADLVLTNVNRHKSMNQVRREISRDMIRAVEDELFLDSATVVNDSMKFADLSFDEDGNIDSYPESWDKELSPRDLQKRLRVAKANWLTSNEVPHGVKMAKDIAVGIMKSRAGDGQEAKALRIESIVMPAPTPMKEFGEVEVDE